MVIDVPHHHVGDRIEVTVCNKNLCSGETCCVDYLLFLPPPCDKGDPIDPIVPYDTGMKNLKPERISWKQADGEDGIQVIPIPAKNLLNLKSPEKLSGQTELLQYARKHHVGKDIDGCARNID